MLGGASQIVRRIRTKCNGIKINSPFVKRTTAVVHADAAIVSVVMSGPSETLRDGFTLGLTEKTFDEFGRNMYAPLFWSSQTYLVESSRVRAGACE